MPPSAHRRTGDHVHPVPAGTLEHTTTFREFLLTSTESADPRRQKFARMNVGLVIIAVSICGIVAARLTDNNVIAIVGASAVGINLVLTANYLVFRRGE